MKRTFTLVLIITTIIGTSAFISEKQSTGFAGYTGSPGELTCSGGGTCHGGGSSASSGLTITSVPAFSTNINSETEYMPDTTYQITISMSAAGFTRFGFGCEIIDDANANAGSMQNQGPGVKFLLGPAQKRNAVHTTPKIGTSVSFTFKWVAPSSDNATIYAIGNAVNGNGNTAGDFVLAPVSLPLVPAPTPTTDVGIKEVKTTLSQVSVFPNPASDLTNLAYDLKNNGKVTIDLIDIKGVRVKELFNQEETPGQHSQILNLQGVASGVYFLKISVNNEKGSQKLITVH